MDTGAILLSGGIDSAALAAWKRPKFAITIDYGQRSAAGELRAASRIADDLGLRLKVITIDSRQLGSGDLAGKPGLEEAPTSDWWPYRNQFLLTVAAMRAIALNVDQIMIGTVASDSMFADGSKEFVDSIDHLLSIQERGMRIIAPAIDMTSVDLVRVSEIDPQTLAWTHSCHKDEFACGECRGCVKHNDVFAALRLA